MKAILRYARKDPKDGLFNDKENGRAILPMLRDMYPGDLITEDDFVLSCNKEWTRLYRQPILKLIGPENMKRHGAALQELAETVLKASWGKGDKISATHLTMIYSTSVISKLLLGHPGPFKTYKTISSALDLLSVFTIKKAWRRPFSQKELKEYEESLEIMRQAIDTAMTTREKPIFGSLVEGIKEKMTPIQMKLTLFTTYFAGSETAASVLCYLLWQLGQHPEVQEEIFQEVSASSKPLHEIAADSKTIDRLFAESIRLFCPGYVINRQPASDILCRATNAEGKVVFQERFGKNETLMCAPAFAARDPTQYPNPNQFNPHRFENPPKTLPWFPFSDGQHTCPGQWLAKAEIAIFVAVIVQQYTITSFPSEEVGQKGYLTLKLAEDIQIALAAR